MLCACAARKQTSAARLAERMQPSHCGVGSGAGMGGAAGGEGEGDAWERMWTLLQISVMVGLAAGAALALVRTAMRGSISKPKLN